MIKEFIVCIILGILFRVELSLKRDLKDCWGLVAIVLVLAVVTLFRINPALVAVIAVVIVAFLVFVIARVVATRRRQVSIERRYTLAFPLKPL